MNWPIRKLQIHKFVLIEFPPSIGKKDSHYQMAKISHIWKWFAISTFDIIVEGITFV